LNGCLNYIIHYLIIVRHMALSSVFRVSLEMQRVQQNSSDVKDTRWEPVRSSGHIILSGYFASLCTAVRFYFIPVTTISLSLSLSLESDKKLVEVHLYKLHLMLQNYESIGKHVAGSLVCYDFTLVSTKHFVQ